MFNFKKSKEMTAKTKKNGDVVIKNHPLAKKVVIINDPKMAAKHARKLTVMVQPSQMKICADQLKEFIKTDLGKASLIGTGGVAIAGGVLASVMAIRRKHRLKKVTQSILDSIIVLGDEKTVDEWLASAYAETCQNSLYLNLSDKEKIEVLNLIRHVIIENTIRQNDALSIHDFDDFDWDESGSESGLAYDDDDDDELYSTIAEDINEINCGTAEPPVLPTEDEVNYEPEEEPQDAEESVSVTEKIKGAGKSQKEKFQDKWKTGNNNPKPD